MNSLSETLQKAGSSSLWGVKNLDYSPLDSATMPPKMKKSRNEDIIYNNVIVSDDILENHILPRLSVDSLFRFRCVCKRWMTLITDDPGFRVQQSLVFKPPSGLLYWNNKMLAFLSTDGRRMSVPDPELSFLKVGKIVSVKTSCGGLICGFYLFCNRWMEIYVCNPVTREVRYIPNPERRCIVGLAFNPFDHDPYYELVCPFKVNKHVAHTEYGFDLYSSRTRVWRELKGRILVSSRSPVTCSSFFIDGIIFFETSSNVVWTDINKELVGVTPLPLSNERRASTVGKFKSRLSYSQVTLSEIEIWTLKDFSWEKVYSFAFDTLNRRCHRHSPSLNIIEHIKKAPRTVEASIWNLEAKKQRFRPLPLVLENIFLFQVGTEVYFYNIASSKVSSFCPYAGEMVNITCLPYINSLVTLP